MINFSQSYKAATAPRLFRREDRPLKKKDHKKETTKNTPSQKATSPPKLVRPQEINSFRPQERLPRENLAPRIGTWTCSHAGLGVSVIPFRSACAAGFPGVQPVSSLLLAPQNEVPPFSLSVLERFRYLSQPPWNGSASAADTAGSVIPFWAGRSGRQGLFGFFDPTGSTGAL
jgi:hypothetical protein